MFWAYVKIYPKVTEKTSKDRPKKSSSIYVFRRFVSILGFVFRLSIRLRDLIYVSLRLFCPNFFVKLQFDLPSILWIRIVKARNTETGFAPSPAPFNSHHFCVQWSEPFSLHTWWIIPCVPVLLPLFFHAHYSIKLVC